MTSVRTDLRLLDHDFRNSQYILILIAVAVGIGGGFGSVLFRSLLEWVTELVHAHLRPALLQISGLWLVPAVGGLAAGLLIHHFAREAKGHGVPEVMKAMVLNQSRIRPRVALVKALASACTLGSGGSAGSEGPIIQIGSACGSAIGQVLHFPVRYTRTLLACGPAAGIAAIFNAPLGGVLFSMEVILADFRIASFTPVVLSAVLSAGVARAFYGNATVLTVPDYGFGSYTGLIWFPVLGILVGCLAVLFIKLLYGSEDLFGGRLQAIPEWVKPAVGGALVGAVGLAYPEAMGVGYEVIAEALNGNLLWTSLLVLFGLKLLTTCLTLGSGGSGGIFAPSLFLGAMLGGGFGGVANHWFPQEMTPTGAFAVVGMAAMVAAATHAPLTAMLIIFEMTGSYSLILPLMLTTIVAVAIARLVEPESIYTLKLARLSLNPHRGRDLSILDDEFVSVILRRDYDTVSESTTSGEMARLVQGGRQHDFPVTDETGRLVGMAPFSALRQIITENAAHEVIVASDILKSCPTLTLQDSLADALHLFAETSDDVIPVVRLGSPEHLAGIITRGDLMVFYEQKLALRGREMAPVSEAPEPAVINS